MSETSDSPSSDSIWIPLVLKYGILYSYWRTAILVFAQQFLGIGCALLAGEPLLQVISDSWMYLWVILWFLVTFLVRRAIDGGLKLFQVPISPYDPVSPLHDRKKKVLVKAAKSSPNKPEHDEATWSYAPFFNPPFHYNARRKKQLHRLLKDPAKEDKTLEKMARLESLFTKKSDFKKYRLSISSKMSPMMRWPQFSLEWKTIRFRLKIPRQVSFTWGTMPAEIVFGLLAGMFFLLGYVPWNASIGMQPGHWHPIWYPAYLLVNVVGLLLWAIFLVSFVVIYIAMISGIGEIADEPKKLGIYKYFSLLKEGSSPTKDHVVDYHVFAERTRPIGEMQANVTFGLLAIILMLEIYWTATNILWGWDVGIMGVLIAWLANAGILVLFIKPQLSIHTMLSNYRTAIRNRLVVKRIRVNTDLVIGTTINPNLKDIRSTETEITKNMKILDSLDSMIERLDDDSTWAVDVKMITQMITPVLFAIPNLLIQGFRFLVFG